MDIRVYSEFKKKYPNRVIVFKESNPKYIEGKSPKFFYNCYDEDASTLRATLGYRIVYSDSVKCERCGSPHYRRICDAFISNGQSFMLVRGKNILYKWDAPQYLNKEHAYYRIIRIEGYDNNREFAKILDLLLDYKVRCTVLDGGIFIDELAVNNDDIALQQEPVQENGEYIEMDDDDDDELVSQESLQINGESATLNTEQTIVNVISEEEISDNKHAILAEDFIKMPERSAVEFYHLIYEHENRKRRPDCDNCQLRYNEKCTALRADATKCDDYIYRPEIDRILRPELRNYSGGYYARSPKYDDFVYNDYGYDYYGYDSWY